MIDTAVLARLAARASTPEERLTPAFVPEPDAGDIIASRLARWAALGAKGDPDRLRRSLAWRGLELDRLRPALGPVRLAPGAALPPWVPRFAALLHAALTGHREAPPPAAPVPEHAAVTAPFAAAAAARLRRALPAGAAGGVAASALAALERTLAIRLARIAGPVLAHLYYAFAYVDSRDNGPPATRARRFVAHVLDPPLPVLFDEYPVLARLLTLACDNWHDAALELLRRLADDRAAIAGRFNGGADAGDLAGIEVGDADVHDGHREVVILLFAGGLRLVYKPRSLDLDLAFERLVEWLNARGLSPALRSPGVLCRDGYGWAEFVAHRAAADAAGLALFYRRAGALACLAYVLGATDLHHGNVIAAGDAPVPVDLETMLSAVPRPGSLPGPTLADPGEPHRSVLSSLLLPVCQRLPSGLHADLSTLGAEPRDAGSAVTNLLHLPRADEPLAALLARHADDIEAGLVAAYRLIARERAALTAGDGPLAAFRDCAIRVVLRDTTLYFRILRHSIDPAVLRDGADRAIALERVNHVIAIAGEKPGFVAMVPRELAALAGLDVPRFMVPAAGTALTDAGGLVAEAVMDRSPLAEARLRLAMMGEADLARQCEDVRLALRARIAAAPAMWPAPAARPVAPPEADACIAAAEALAEALLREAAESGAMPPPWRGLIYVSAAGRFTVGDAGASFADGGAGIAVFLAALFRITGKERWRTGALGLLDRYLPPLLSAAGYHGHVAAGLADGLGGAMYASAWVAALTGSETALCQGVALARRFAGRAISGGSGVSLAEGLAGTVPGLAALHRLAPEAGLSGLLEQAGAGLAAGERPAAPGLLTGRAGVAAAAHACGVPRLGELPAPGSERRLDWGEGGLGIAVARLQADSADAAALATFERLRNAPPPRDDSFAFGSAGEADALLWAAQRAGRPDFGALAGRRMAEAAARAQIGAPRLLCGLLASGPSSRGSSIRGHRIPGLLHGAAGIGYALLRLAAGPRLPALAALDIPEQGAML